MHVEEAPRVCRVLPDVDGLSDFGPICSATIRLGPIKIRLRGSCAVAPGKNGGRSRPTGIFPLGFRGQSVFPTDGQTARGLFNLVETGKEDLGILPRNPFHGPIVVVRPLAGFGI